MNYESMSDFEINKAVARLLGTKSATLAMTLVLVPCGLLFLIMNVMALWITAITQTTCGR